MTLGLTPPARRRSGEPVVPMINVVFLLLIFFLMTAVIVPPAPLDLTPPDGEGEAARAADTLYVDASGDMAFEGLTGPAALAAAQARDGPLTLAVDKDLTAARLAGILIQLHGGGRALMLTLEGP